MALLKKLLLLIAVFAVTLVIPQIAYNLSAVFIPVSDMGDPWKAFVFMTIHHGVQLLLSLAVLKLWLRKDLSSLCFNMGNRAFSLKVLKWFLICWSIVVAMFYLVCFLTGFDLKSYVSGYFPADMRYLAKDAAYELFIPGISEEPLFRAFVVLAMLGSWPGSIRLGKLELPYVALISGVIFMIALINYSIYPFAITHYDPVQLATSFTVGVLWAAVFVRTRSLLGPVLGHNGANMIQMLSGYMLSFLLNR